MHKLNTQFKHKTADKTHGENKIMKVTSP